MPMFRALQLPALFALAACGTSPQASDTSAVPTTNAAAVAMVGSPPLAPAQPRACSAEIGMAAAAKRATVCRNVSPATRPPCSARNSCAMIENEIARSCALFDGKGPTMAGCVPAPTSMAAAADVVRRYYSALDARDYATAWAQWGDHGPPGQTRASFTRGFARTRAVRVTIGRLTPGDAGAGSIYQTIPVAVEATLTDGTRQRFTGDYVVRRVNGVDGASPAQLRWHLDSAKLRQVK